jgi:hypothetical protein
MKHVELLMQMPHARKGDAASLRNLINHFSSNYNAVEALQLATNMQSLMSTHSLLSALDPDTRKAGVSYYWEVKEIYAVIIFIEVEGLGVFGLCICGWY